MSSLYSTCSFSHNFRLSQHCDTHASVTEYPQAQRLTDIRVLLKSLFLAYYLTHSQFSQGTKLTTTVMILAYGWKDPSRSRHRRLDDELRKCARLPSGKILFHVVKFLLLTYLFVPSTELSPRGTNSRTTSSLGDGISGERDERCRPFLAPGYVIMRDSNARN